MSNTCSDCIHKDVCYLYRLNYVCAREGCCTNFISKESVPDNSCILDEKSSSLLMDIIEDRCSCCGNPLMQNEGTIIVGRCRTYILCSDCDKRKDEFIKWSDEE